MAPLVGKLLSNSDDSGAAAGKNEGFNDGPEPDLPPQPTLRCSCCWQAALLDLLKYRADVQRTLFTLLHNSLRASRF